MNSNFNQGLTIKSGQQNFTGNISQVHSGSGDNVGGDKVMNYYSSSLSPSLTQTAEEIKDLLNELDKQYANDSVTIGIKAIEEIRDNPALKSRFINALKAGGTEIFDQSINHPALGIIVAAGKGFIAAEI